MPTDYIAEYILLGYFARKQKAGSEHQREEYSQSLFDDFDQDIRDIAPTQGIPSTREARSMIAVLAGQAPGNSKRVKARRAVIAYRQFLGIPPP